MDYRKSKHDGSTCLSYATIAAASTIRIRATHLGLIRPAEGTDAANMRRIIDAHRFTPYWRTISIRPIARRAMFRVARRLMRHAQLYALAKRSIAWVPFLDRRLRATIRAGELDAQDRAERIVDVADLTPHGQQVYFDLLRAIEDLH